MNGLPWIEVIYWASTVIGGTLFLLRTILLLVGGIGSEGFDTDVDGDFEGYMDGDHLDTDVDSDFSFKLLSMQGLTAFFMMFGLVGLALLRADLAVFLTVIGGGAAGLVAVWVISLLFSQMKRLQADGTLNIQNAIGESGSVYLNIPSLGTGQVQLPVQGALKILDAASKDEIPILTGQRVRVVGVIDNHTVIVEKI